MQSSGKGIISTKFLRWRKSIIPKRIITNCYINDKDAIIKTSEEIYKYSKQPSLFRNSYLYITEMHNIIDARRTNSLMNTNFTQFLTQVGKIDCDIIYDSQLIVTAQQVDIRLREFTPLRFICSRYKIVNNKMIPAIFEPRIIKEQIAILIEMDLTTGDKTKHKKIGYYKPTKEDFEYYQTREIVTLDREKFLKK